MTPAVDLDFAAFLAETPTLREPQGKLSPLNADADFMAFISDKTPIVELPAPKSGVERNQAWRAKRASKRLQNVAILDMETEPFDNVSQDFVTPFLAVLYSTEFETIIIWEEDYNTFVEKVYSAIVNLPDTFTIYAHNGGKFDFLFLIRKLRGEISFKGRGIMVAHIGKHELRDSFHIIPEKLANYRKTEFDYDKMKRAFRAKWRAEIIAYCIDDCVFLLALIQKFLQTHGFKISIGAAALAKMRENYKIETLGDGQDAALRPFYLGGRVECIQGAGYFQGVFKLYDVNSMYPAAMAQERHPIGSEYSSREGTPSQFTAFVELECFNNGALFQRDDNHETNVTWGHGRFLTTIHEYKMAKELGLIENIKIRRCVDNNQFTTFEKFVNPFYELRAEMKEQFDTLKESDPSYYGMKGDILILKLVLNNAYGKCAINPRRFKDYYMTDPYELPPKEKDGSNSYGDFPAYRGYDYWIWERSTLRKKFLNVGTAASVTGAARAKLMRAIHFAKNPIYCDTDSLICEELRNVEIHSSKLGTWKFETDISEAIITGKKQYGYKTPSGKTKIRAKGANGVTWTDLEAMLIGETIAKTGFGPTLTRRATQAYITRHIRATARLPNGSIEKSIRNSAFS